MQIPSFRIQFRLSHNEMKIVDISIIGLTFFTIFKIYSINKRRKEDKQNLKRLRYLYTAKECQQLQLDSNQITVQGKIQNDSQYLFLHSQNYINNKKGFSIIYDKRQENKPCFQIKDPSSNARIQGILTKDCVFDETLNNYSQKWNYQSKIPSKGNYLVRLFLKIKNYFFGKTLVEQLAGIDADQYFVFKGILKKQDKNLYLEIDHIVLNPTIFYQQIKNNIENSKFKIFLLTIAGAFLFVISLSRLKVYFPSKENHGVLFHKRESEVDRDQDLCIACLTNVRNVLILPCYHLVCCQDCLNRVVQRNNLCPLCRGEIQEQKQLLIDNQY